MALTPCSTDPNREAELARKAREPQSFGEDAQVMTQTQVAEAIGKKDDKPIATQPRKIGG